MYKEGEWITRAVVAIVALALVVFAIPTAWIILEAFLDTSFNFSLTGSASLLANNFTVYGFISIEATLLAVIIYIGYWTLRNATKRKVIEVQVEN